VHTRCSSGWGGGKDSTRNITIDTCPPTLLVPNYYSWHEKERVPSDSLVLQDRVLVPLCRSGCMANKKVDAVMGSDAEENTTTMNENTPNKATTTTTHNNTIRWSMMR